MKILEPNALHVMHLWPLLVLCLAMLMSLETSSKAQTRSEAAPEDARFYVSPQGRDTNSGTQNAPFATPQRARDAVRAHKASGKSGPVRVVFRGGTYFLAAPLELGAQDSGTPESPVTYAAFEGETPILSGGMKISGWKKAGHLWTTTVEGVKEGATPYFRQLWVGGERRHRARTPNEGFLRVAASEGAMKSGHGYLKPVSQFQFTRGDIRSDWTNLRDVEVVALHFWVSTNLPIERVDETTNTVHFSRGALLKFSDDNTAKGARYFVDNVYEALDAPGEWYLNRQTGLLSYWPLPGEDMERAEVIAPRLTSLVRFKGEAEAGKLVENIDLRGLTLSHNEWDLPREARFPTQQAAFYLPGLVSLAGARNVSLEDCRLKNFGTYGVDITSGCSQIRVARCEIADGGGGGVKIDGGGADSPLALRTGSNHIEDCEIHHLGELFPAALGVLIQNSANNTVAHNHIHHLYYSGVSVGWRWGYKPSVSQGNLIEWNHIHHIGQGLLSDMGGIYTLGISPQTAIRNNLVHDIASHGYGGWGIYLDEGSSEIAVENNLVYSTKSNPFNQHYGRANVVRNNIFVGGEAVISHSKADPETGQFRMERNILLSNGQPFYGGGHHGTDITKGAFESDSNLLWDTSGRFIIARNARNFGHATLSLDEWRAVNQDKASLVADPMFVDAARGDFRLKAGSPALKIGFVPFDLSRVGPRVLQR